MITQLKILRFSIFLLATLQLTGCCTKSPRSTSTLGGYAPTDPMAVTVAIAGVPTPTDDQKRQLLDSADWRLTTAETDASGNATYGPATVAASGTNYTVTLDYIKYTMKNYPTDVTTTADPRNPGRHITTLVRANAGAVPAGTTRENVPLYIGIGIRLEATLSVSQGGFNLGNLTAIGAAGDAHQVSGSLHFRLLGLSGQDIDNVYNTVPTDITTTAIQDALVAMGTIKSKIYDATTKVNPKIVGIDNVYGADKAQVINYISSVSANPPTIP